MLGRTGNNLFQYALGRVLAKRHRVPLVMDGSWFRAGDWEAVSCLRRLPIRARVVRGWSLGSRALRKLAGRHPWEFLGVPVWREVDGHAGFDPSFLGVPKDCVLMGYFQSERYFEPIADELRETLDLSTLRWSAETREAARRLEEGETVAVHVRRTDFVGRREFDLCGPDYYRRALSRLRASLDTPRFFLFSDDPGWCRSHLAGEDVEVMALPGMAGDPLHDLHLMSRARHQVIANSSYSWWAAWLARKPGQRVIAPDRWFGGEIEAPTGDRLLEGWETLPAEGNT